MHSPQTKRRPIFSNLKGDLAGGLAAAVLALTGNIIFGMIAYAPLGPAYAGFGIIAGMTCTVVNGVLTNLFGGVPILISGPVIPAAFIFSALLQKLLASGAFDPAAQAGVFGALSVGFFMVLLSGLFQILFGVLRLGNLVKNISYPVVAGIINGTSLLIILKHIAPFLGVAPGRLFAVFTQPALISVPAVLSAAGTVCLMTAAERMKLRAPPSVLGVTGGAMIYYGVRALWPTAAAAPVIGDIPLAVPTLSHVSTFLALAPDLLSWDMLLMIGPAAFAVAVLGAVDSLLVIASLQSLTRRRPRGNREVIAQGTGNAVGALFGAIPASAYLGRSTLNHASGGRTRLSCVFCALAVLIFILFLTRPIGYIPHAVMAGIIIHTAVRIIDRRSLEIARSLFTGGTARRRELVLDFFVIVAVMVVTLIFDLITAVVAGILFSVFIFIDQMSRSIVRKSGAGGRLVSKKERTQAQADALKERAGDIIILELEGALFFGSADNLADEIEAGAERGARHIVLDMKRVSRIDSTGGKVLEQTFLLMRRQGVDLAVSYADGRSDLWRQFRDLKLDEALGAGRFFPDTSLAVEAFEDRILAECGLGFRARAELSAGDLLRARGLEAGDVAVLTKYLDRLEFAAGENIVSRGERERSIFLLAAGLADVMIPLPGGRAKRVQTLTPGAAFGEMSLIDAAPRSADITAGAAAVCYRLDHDRFLELRAAHPGTAMNLYAAIARIISERLRSANILISELEA